MKIVIPGGSGQVGTLLARAFVADGLEVVVLSRSIRKAPWRVVGWDGETVGEWAAEPRPMLRAAARTNRGLWRLRCQHS